MKEPAFFSVVVLKHQFVYDVKIAEREVLEPSQLVVVVAGYIINFYTTAKHAGDLFYHLHVTLRPVFFIELPDVGYVAVENEDARINCGKIPAKLLCPATISAQMHIGNNNDIGFSFFQRG